MEFLLDGFRAVTWQQGVMYLVGFALIYLAIQKDYEPALLPMGFGAILVNLPSSGVLNQMVEGIGESQGIIQWLFETTIEASEALPLLLFIGIGAMIDFGPLLSNPKMLLFGAAAQFGIFFTGEPGTNRAAERMAFPCRAVSASVLCRVGPLFCGRKIALLRCAFLFVPMPLVVFPVLYFLCAAIWLHNVPAVLLMMIFGAAHLTVSLRSFRSAPE